MDFGGAGLGVSQAAHLTSSAELRTKQVSQSQAPGGFLNRVDNGTKALPLSFSDESDSIEINDRKEHRLMLLNYSKQNLITLREKSEGMREREREWGRDKDRERKRK